MFILWMFFLARIIIVSSDNLWNEVLVATSLLDGSFVSSSTGYQIQYLQIPKLICGTSCDRFGWCSLWCPNSANGTCLLSNALVSPLHITNSSNVYNCFTNQGKDFVVGGTGTSSPVGFANPTRVASNLVQGIYNYNSYLTCCVLTSSLNPWILIKLKNPQTIREIIITTFSYNFPSELPNNVEIRAGTTLPVATGNFTNYEIFGTLPSQMSLTMTYSLLNKNGMKNIQYISLQRYSTTIGFGICQIMAL